MERAHTNGVPSIPGYQGILTKNDPLPDRVWNTSGETLEIALGNTPPNTPLGMLMDPFLMDNCYESPVLILYP